MDIFEQAVVRIIQAQEEIIGPIALEQAKKVNGLKVNWLKHEVKIEGDKKTVLDQLIRQYENLFGRASIEVCREAIKDIIIEVPPDRLPSLIVS
jgi:hypothetical protein